jgi:hypothetical protein
MYARTLLAREMTGVKTSGLQMDTTRLAAISGGRQVFSITASVVMSTMHSRCYVQIWSLGFEFSFLQEKARSSSFLWGEGVRFEVFTAEFY